MWCDAGAERNGMPAVKLAGVDGRPRGASVDQTSGRMGLWCKFLTELAGQAWV